MLYVGDYNGDGHDDLLCNSQNGTMAIDYANTAGEFWSTNWTKARGLCDSPGQTLYVQDFDGDGRQDLLCRIDATGSLMIDLANSKGEFHTTNHWAAFDRWCTGAGSQFQVGSFDPYDKGDLLCNESSGRLSIEYGAIVHPVFQDDIYGVVPPGASQNYPVVIEEPFQTLGSTFRWSGAPSTGLAPGDGGAAPCSMGLEIYQPEGRLLSTYAITKTHNFITIPEPETGEWLYEVSTTCPTSQHFAITTASVTISQVYLPLVFK